MLSWPTTYRGLKGVERSEKMACFDHRSRQAFDRDREAGTVHERYGRDQIETCLIYDLLNVAATETPHLPDNSQPRVPKGKR